MAIKQGDIWKYEAQAELVEDVLHNEDVTFRLNGTVYNMGASSSYVRQINVCPDGAGTELSSAEEQLAYIIDGKPLRDHWRDMELLS